MHPSIAALTFGAEFEVLLPPHFRQDTAAAEFSRLMGEPVSPRLAMAQPGQWKVVTDGSVSGPGCVGLEFVSPILQGQPGLDNIARAVAALRAMGATVNKSCGFHVHVGGHDRSVGFFKTLVKLYGRFEDAIDMLMPAGRRGNQEYYCRAVDLVRGIDAAASVAELGSMLVRASRGGAVKYHKVNIAPLGKPTVEFRHHAGTVDAVKAINWITTCLRLVRAAMDGKTGESGATAVQAIAWDLARLSGKQLHAATLVARAQGATNDEIRAAYGHRVFSAKKQLTDARLAYRVVRERGKDRFFAVLPTETVEVVAADAPFPVTLDGLADLIGSEGAEREYFRARAARAVA